MEPEAWIVNEAEIKEPLCKIEQARQELADLSKIVRSDVYQLSLAANAGGGGGPDGTIRKALKDSSAMRKEAEERLKKLELEKGLLVTAAELQELRTGFVAMSGRLRDLPGQLAAAASSGDIGIFYEKFWEWVGNSWNPIVQNAGAFYDNLAVRKMPAVEKWIRAEVMLPKAFSPSAPGKVNFDRAPWMVDVLKAGADPRVRNIDLVLAAQCGKTTLCALMAAMWLEWEGGPLMWAVPTDGFAKDFAKARFKPFLFAQDFLRGKYKGDKDSESTGVPVMNFESGLVIVSGMDNPAKAASWPIQWIIADEVEKFEQKKKQEAKPLLLLEQRRKTFTRSVMVRASTPTVESTAFYQGFLQSSQNYFLMPCPCCG